MDRRSRSKGGKLQRMFWLVVLVAGAIAALMTFRVGGTPEIEITSDLPGIGRSTPVSVRFSEAQRGLERLEVELVQGERVVSLAQKRHVPRQAWQFWGPMISEDRITLEIGTATVEDLRSGDAMIRATAWPASTWLRRPEAVVEELVLPVRLTPPSVQVVSSQHYVAPGGAGVVVYRVGETAVRHGVRAGDWWFPGYALPGAEQGLQFSLFGIPFDLEDGVAIRLQATDDVGNEAVVPFVDRLFEQTFKTDQIQLSDEFMNRVVPAIVSASPEFEDQGGLLANYLWINGELRSRNAETLVELGRNSQREWLWNTTFLPMAKGQVMSSFADRRTYIYKGEAVDQQDHLGFDLASVRHAEIQASNAGVVALARFFGIYGNTVIIDHGFGLMSLYGHLSSLGVEEGDRVDRGQVIGRSGETGLAGGDHLHFTFLIQGRAVTPVEWWDGSWIRDRVAGKLQGSLPFQP